jgi:endonuclease-8
MVDELNQEEIVRRFRVHNLTPIGEAIMNQTIVCGIGNVYKSETLFLAAVDPFVRVAELSESEIMAIVTRAQTLMCKNSLGYPRQTRLSSDGERLWVYGRNGKPCFQCGTQIRIRRQGDLGRSTYWCPSCQGV